MNVVLYTMTHCIRSTLFWMQFKLLFFFKGRLLGLKVRLFRVLHMNSHALAVCPNILQGDKTSFWKENSKEWWITWKRMQTCVTTYAENTFVVSCDVWWMDCCDGKSSLTSWLVSLRQALPAHHLRTEVYWWSYTCSTAVLRQSSTWEHKHQIIFAAHTGYTS